MASCIHFIRHGITEGITNRWYYGSTDLPLVQEGIDEVMQYKAEGVYPFIPASKCSDDFDTATLDAIDFYSSGMLRADQTLDVIYGEVPRTAIKALQEMDFGRWECKTFAQIEQEPECKEWMECTDNSFVFPEGESILSFYDRVNGGLDELIGLHRLKELSNRHSGNDSVSIIVCHGGVIAAAMERFFSGDKENFWQWVPAPGRGYTLHLENGEPVRYEVL